MKKFILELDEELLNKVDSYSKESRINNRNGTIRFILNSYLDNLSILSKTA